MSKPMKCVLEPNREDRARYVTIIHYIPEPGWCGRLAEGGPLRVVPLRRTLEWLLVGDRWVLTCTRSTILRWDQVRLGRAPQELQAEWLAHLSQLNKDGTRKVSGIAEWIPVAPFGEAQQAA